MAELINGQGELLDDAWVGLPRCAQPADAPETGAWVLAPSHEMNAREIDLASLQDCAGIELVFPDFVDGRAYSQASTLRLDGYTGPLRAVGDVLVDQLYLMRRCGFDQFLLAEGLKRDDAQRALAQFRVAAQPARNDTDLSIRGAPAPATTGL